MLAETAITQLVDSIERNFCSKNIVFIQIDCYASLLPLKTLKIKTYPPISSIINKMESYFQNGGVGGTLCVTSKGCYNAQKINHEILDEYNIEVIKIPSSKNRATKSQINIFCEVR